MSHPDPKFDSEDRSAESTPSAEKPDDSEQADRLAIDLCQQLREQWQNDTATPVKDLIQKHPVLQESVMAMIDLAVTELEIVSTRPGFAGRDEWITELSGVVQQPNRHHFESEIRKRIELIQFSDRLGTDEKALQQVADSTLPKVDNFRILSVLGEGGMGIVYRAEQLSPVRRQVALKVIKPGMDSRDVLRRFEIERQALAIMNHQSIARILDAGLTLDGRPFFVMEYVSGKPIVDFCREHQVSLGDRLKLMLMVCEAVQHAHQKGIIHRDLKPTNILVSRLESNSESVGPSFQVKVIDFGLAKAIGGGLRADTLQTQIGQIVGTLEYMSPEQAGAIEMDIDTRSDIYSLGVILYELLTGTTLIRSKSRKPSDLIEVKRLFESVDSKRPSSELSSSRHDPSPVAAREFDVTRSPGFQRRLRGELDWIVSKAVSFQRNRRFESIHSLASDIRCYLEDQPISARPPSFRYRMSKLIRRNWLAFSTGGIVLLALLATLAVVIVFYQKENRLNRQLVIARNEAEASAVKAKQNADQAGKNAEKAIRQEKLAFENEERTRKALLLGDSIVKSIGELKHDHRLSGKLEDIRKTITKLEADYHQQTMKLLGENEFSKRRYATKLFSSANYDHRFGNQKDAANSMEQAISQMREILASSKKKIRSLDPSDVSQHEKQAQQWNEDAVQLVRMYRMNGLIYVRMNRLAIALDNAKLGDQLLNELLSESPDDIKLMQLFGNIQTLMGDVHYHRKENDLAIGKFEEALDAYKQIDEVGESNYEILSETGFLYNNLAGIYAVKREFKKSTPLFEKGAEFLERSLKLNSTYVNSLSGLARSYYGLSIANLFSGKPEPAAEYAEKAVSASSKAVELFPLVAGYQFESGIHQFHYANLLAKDGPNEKAINMLDQSIGGFEFAFQHQANHNDYREKLMQALSLKSQWLDREKDKDEIEKIGQRMKELGQ